MVWIEKIYQAPPNSGELILGKALPELLDEACDRTPNNLAFNQWTNRSWQSFSNQALRQKVTTTALGLLELGLKRDDRIALLMHSDVHFCITDLATLTANLINVPIDLTQTLEHIIFVLQHSEASALIISNSDLLEQIAPYLTDVPHLRHIIIATPSPPPPSPPPSPPTPVLHPESTGLELPMLLHPVPDHAHIPLPDWMKVLSLDEVQAKGQSQVSATRIAQLQKSRNPHQTATIVYIPDEEGKLQGAMLTHENLSANAIAAFSGISDLQWGDKEVVLNFLPLNHVLARCMIYGHIYYGHSIYFSNPNRVMKHLQEVRPTVLTVVPLFLEKLYSKILEKGNKLHLVGRLLFHWALKLAQRYELGKSPWGFYALQLKLANRFVFSQWRSLFGGRLKHIICGGAPLKAELANVYGIAVTPILYGYGLTQASAVVCYNRGSLNRAGTVGTPIAGAEVAIALDGEVLLRGPFLTQGFYKNQTATRELIDNQGWLHTGDLGSFTPEGFLQITGLKKALFKLSTGKYIAPKPIEQRLTQSPLIAQAIVVGAEQKFCSVLIVPNLPALHRYALEIGIDLPVDDLLKHPYITVLYRTLVDNANCHLPYWATVKQFRLINTPLTVENGLLSPTGQINRTQTIQRFAREMATLYGEETHRDSAPLLTDFPFPPVPETACPTYARSLNPRLTTLWLLVIGHYWSLVISH